MAIQKIRPNHTDNKRHRAKTGNPDHTITIKAEHHHIKMMFDGQIVANTRHALTLYETGYKPVLYIPRADVQENLLQASSHHTFCPYKGDASYYTLSSGSKLAENAVWSYESPLSEVASVQGHLAFFIDQLDACSQQNINLSQTIEKQAAILNSDRVIKEGSS